jgi:hypothetical protein
MGAQQTGAEVGAAIDHGRTVRDSAERRIRDLISSGDITGTMVNVDGGLIAMHPAV